MKLNATQRDRSVGVLIATAAGDALGAGYEFDGPMAADAPVDMIGGGLGPFAPGEWTDDTSMAVAIAEIAATGADLRDAGSLDYIVERWHGWSRTAKDIGVQTSRVLSAAARAEISARTARVESEALHRATGRSAGNGSLMRTAPVALAYLDDEDGLVQAARTISELTHFDPEAGDACVLWCLAIRHAVLTGDLDVRIGLGHIDSDRRELWVSRIDDAARKHPADFTANNGWVVAALQGAWSAIITTPVPDDGDTDTVAAIAGGLLGAAYGASAVPWNWRRVLKGWPGLNTRGLAHLADRIINGGVPDRFDTTYGYWDAVTPPVPHPYDDGVWLGTASSLGTLPPDVDAIVSLCRVSDDDIPSGAVHLDVRLIDQVGVNTNLDFVLVDTVRAVEQLRAEGRTVFLHCAAAQSRTPTIGAIYGARLRGVDVDRALRDVCDVLSDADPNPDFHAALRRVHPGG